jgi:hypothetical protein
MQYVIQGLVVLIVLLFLSMGANFVFNPVAAGGGIGLEALDVNGMSSLRGDMGGLFLGTAALLIYGLVRRHEGAFLAVALYMGAIALCRIVGFVQEGTSEAALTAFGVEIVIVVLLWYASIRLPKLRQQ